MTWLYAAHDLFTTSPCEAARDQYARVIRDIEDAVRVIRSDIAAACAQLDNNLPQYRGWTVGDASAGLFVTDFETALGRWESRVDGLIMSGGALVQAADDLDGKLVLLRSRKATLDQMCADEDAREVEYSEAEIPF